MRIGRIMTDVQILGCLLAWEGEILDVPSNSKNIVVKNLCRDLHNQVTESHSSNSTTISRDPGTEGESESVMSQPQRGTVKQLWAILICLSECIESQSLWQTEGSFNQRWDSDNEEASGSFCGVTIICGILHFSLIANVVRPSYTFNDSKQSSNALLWNLCEDKYVHQ